LLFNRGLTSALERASPDVIVCGGYNYLASWQAMNWARERQTRFLLWIESTFADQRTGSAVVEFLKRKFIRSCDGFVVPGSSSRRYLRSFGVGDHVIFTAPNAVANTLFEEGSSHILANANWERAERDLPARYLLFVGRLVREKGISDLIQAYKSLKPRCRSELGMVIVGDGPMRPEIENQVAELRSPHVKVVGFVHRDELAAYYALAETFVFPTHTDPWGLVVNEAMACGLPVIASSAGGCVADLVRDTWNGFVVEPKRASELSARISRIAEDSELRAKMCSRSREIISRYSPERCAAGIAAAALNCDAPTSLQADTCASF
jgi:glycosyltransferase involved in cell wall biosynthesis